VLLDRPIARPLPDTQPDPLRCEASSGGGQVMSMRSSVDSNRRDGPQKASAVRVGQLGRGCG